MGDIFTAALKAAVVLAFILGAGIAVVAVLSYQSCGHYHLQVTHD